MSPSLYPFDYTLEGNRLILHREVGIQEREPFTHALAELLSARPGSPEPGGGLRQSGSGRPEGTRTGGAQPAQPASGPGGGGPEGGQELVIDLSAASYVSSSCIGPIVQAADEARRAGRSLVVVACGKVAHILEIAGVGQLVEIREPED